MGLRINTNVASLTAQNNLKSTTSRLNQSLTRLSTGLRINTGKDDVVGLVRSELLRGQIRGLDIAQRNVSNATAFMGVAEGYLSRLTELAQQMRESAVQAAESTIDPASRNALTDNFDQLVDEYNRLTVNANFNGVYLLDGTFVNKELQVGANEGDNLSISISDARSASIGEVAIYTTNTFRVTAAVASTVDLTGGTLSFSKAGSTYTVTEYTDDGVSYVEGDESALAYVNAINGISGSSGIIAKINSNVVTMLYDTGNSLPSNASFIINGVTVKSDTSTFNTSDDTHAATLVNLINDKAVQTGVTATINTTDNDIILTATDGRNITLAVSGGTGTDQNFYGATGSSLSASSTFRGTFRLISEEAFSITTTFAGLNTQTAGGTTNAVQVDSTTSLINADLDDADSAGNAITILDNVLSQLQGLRAEVGSTQTRLDLALTELRSRQENLMSAESLIRDADIAVETARLTQDQILQQAGVTVLAQANASPQIALALLQNLG